MSEERLNEVMERLTVARPEGLERLRAHRLVGGIPPEELEWLVDHGEFVRFAAGAMVAHRKEQIVRMYILFSGQVAIFVERGGSRRRMMEWQAGDVTGILPFSRMTGTPGDTFAVETAEALAIHVRDFPAVVRDCPGLTAVLVHVMIDRARHFVSSDLLDEKLMSLGRLAAGLAHELNNPASAAVRASEQLLAQMVEADAAARALGSAGLSDDQRVAVERVRDLCLLNPKRPITPMERSDREDAIAEWLARHEAEGGSAAPLADTTVTVHALDLLAAAVPEQALDAVLRWIASGCAVRSLAMDIERAASRMHSLVKAVKGFTYMDRATAPEPVDIASGISDSITVLGSKARQKSASVTLDIPPSLPMISGFGGELNQVWSNLIDNALDAVPQGGHVRVSASVQPSVVVVTIADDGTGIPKAVLDRIFEPFFTTKPPGHGTGLGLDIVRRLVMKHAGDIDVESEPGRTEFRVTLPMLPPPAA